jgi:LacI family transcriptional regulator
MKVTMADVAAEAGVNKATVSRVLKGDPRISAVTCEKVWAAVKKLGYRPDVLARGLSTKTTDTIGVVFKQLSPWWVGLYLCGLERVMERIGVEIMIKETSSDDKKRINALKVLSARRVDGLIFVYEKPPAEELNLPVVVVGEHQFDGVSIKFDEKAIVERIEKLSKGQGFRYYPGEGAVYSFLSKYQTQKKNAKCHVLDGRLGQKVEASPDDVLVFCGSQEEASILGAWTLEFPAFHLGALSGRLMINRLRDKRIRPQAVLVVPQIFTPQGELWG